MSVRSRTGIGPGNSDRLSGSRKYVLTDQGPISPAGVTGGYDPMKHVGGVQGVGGVFLISLLYEVGKAAPSIICYYTTLFFSL